MSFKLKDSIPQIVKDELMKLPTTPESLSSPAELPSELNYIYPYPSPTEYYYAYYPQEVYPYPTQEYSTQEYATQEYSTQEYTQDYAYQPYSLEL
jgi:hypothetical protein